MKKNMRALLCPPDFIRIEKEINDLMHHDDPPDPKAAKTEWLELVRDYLELGVDLWFIEADPVFQDMCFPANVAWCRWGKVVLANLIHRVGMARGGEIALYKKWFERYQKHLSDLEIVSWPDRDVGYGGQGDTVTVGSGKTRTVVLVGYGQERTDYEAHHVLRSIHRLEKDQVLPVRLVDGSLYDLDLNVFYIPKFPKTPETLLCFPDGTDAAGRTAYASLPVAKEDRIIVSPEDAAEFVLNSVFVLGRDGETHLIMPGGSKKIEAELKDRGYKVRRRSLTQAKKNGGGTRCHTMFLPDEKA
ncbi:MAG: hypothetical protein A3I44_04865 [Candidatus Sungbacteria bacterium RIFCSPLOWO2_02_FULL_51_17]|nr:MAG: hypothetical protein A3I44_04865 [Candidatus Sungbacteria bacterium RIFCSPLOWO2_02_FULL_51_17]